MSAVNHVNNAIAELEKARKLFAEQETLHLRLHHAYLRLRALIPGAWDTPYGPDPETVWRTTEEALKKALKK